jgi:hypothetical protein
METSGHIWSWSSYGGILYFSTFTPRQKAM